jgi:hypothetical protein
MTDSELLGIFENIAKLGDCVLTFGKPIKLTQTHRWTVRIGNIQEATSRTGYGTTPREALGAALEQLLKARVLGL